jgi:hypothetical protein
MSAIRRKVLNKPAQYFINQQLYQKRKGVPNTFCHRILKVIRCENFELDLLRLNRKRYYGQRKRRGQ